MHFKDKATENPHIKLRTTVISDLETLFVFQRDKEAVRMAAFTSADADDRKKYMAKWMRLLYDKSVNCATILFEGMIAGSIAKYEMNGRAEITYHTGKAFWGKGLATAALKLFLTREAARPLFGRTAFDNIASQRVLEKCGFKKVGTDRGFANARGREIEEYIYRYDGS